MKIKPAVYESLTPRQRVAATLDALGREDTEEVDRLKRTCAYKVYRQQDAAYADTMVEIFALGVAVEAELRGSALWYILSNKSGDMESAEFWLQNLADIRAAWLHTLASMGITSQNAIEAASAPCLSIVERLFEICPEPDAVNVNEQSNQMKEHFGLKSTDETG